MVTAEETIGVLAEAIAHLEPEDTPPELSARTASLVQYGSNETTIRHALIEHALLERLITRRHAESLRYVINSWDSVNLTTRSMAQQLLDYVQAIR